MPRNALAAAGVFEPDPTNPLTGSYTAADAADWHSQNAADTWAAMRDPQTWQDAAEQYRSAMLMGSVAPGMRGSPTAAKWAKQGEKRGLTTIFKADDPQTPRDPAAMTPEQLASLPVVYHGLKPGYNAAGPMFVTLDQSGAAFHGDVTAYHVLPDAKIHADIEGGYTRTGHETLFDPNGSSAIIARHDLSPVADAPPATPGNPLATNAAPEMTGLGLDAQAMKVLRDMTPGFRAYHGSPHSFDQFSSDKIGTGEGAQAYGHGLYLADSEGVARRYRDTLSDKRFRWPTQEAADVYATLPEGYRAHLEAQSLQSGASENDLRDMLGSRVDLARSRLDDHAAGRGPIDTGMPGATMWHPQTEQAIVDAGDWLLARRGFMQPGSSGHMYEVNVASDPAHFLDWDKPRDQLAPNVQAFAKEHYPGAWENAADGSSLYHGMAQNVMRERTVLQTMLDNKRLDGDMREFPTERAQLDAMANPYAYVSKRLQEAGIPGIRYLDGSSRAGGQGTRNHVIFDPETIKILRKYGLAGLMAGGGAAAGVNAGNSE